VNKTGCPIIPAILDDAGLTPAQFRVLCLILTAGADMSATVTTSMGGAA